MNGTSVDYPTPPSANPTKYCRFCYSQFQIKPLFTVDSADQNKNLRSRIESLIQVRLDPVRDGTSAICHMCQQKLAELELFRDRCQKLHEAIRRCRPFPTLELQLEEVQNGGLNYNPNEYSSLCVSNEQLISEDNGFSRMEDDSEPGEETAMNEICKNLNATELSIVVDRDEKRKNNRFWKILTRDVGPIPDHIRHALELTGRCRKASLSFISPSTIKRIEESMRQSVQMLANQEELRGTDLKQAMVKYYGETHWAQPERFCFNLEEKSTILSIASAIQQKGIRHYLKAAKVEDKQVHEKVENGPKLAKILATTIQEYYQARDSATENFKAFFKQLPKMQQCRVYRKPNRSVHAAVRCSICKKDTKATLTAGTTRWYIHNFVRHCEKHHYQVEVDPPTGSGRRRSATPKPERISRTGRSGSRSRCKSLGLSMMGEEEEDEDD